MAVSIDRLFERLGKLSVGFTDGCFKAGAAMAEYLAPKFKGDMGPEAKERYKAEMAIFGEKCERLWGAGKDKAAECLDIYRLGNVVQEIRTFRIDEVRPLLKYALGPVKPADGFKTTWKTSDSDAPGFSRKAVVLAVVEDIKNRVVCGPKAVEAKLKELTGVHSEECLDKASPVEKEQHADQVKAEKAKKEKREKTRIEEKAKELGIKVGVSAPADVARKLVLDNAFRIEVARELVKLSRERDADEPLRTLENVVATFQAEAGLVEA